jgi:hypothetical protein
MKVRKESSGIRLRDTELSSTMDVGKKLKLKWRAWKQLASGWHQERVGIRRDGSGLAANEHASKHTDAALKRTEIPLNSQPCVSGCQDICCRRYIEHRQEFAANRRDAVGWVVSARQASGIRYGPGALSGKGNEARAAGRAVSRATSRHVEEAGPTAARFKGKPNQARGAAARRLRLRRPIGT